MTPELRERIPVAPIGATPFQFKDEEVGINETIETINRYYPGLESTLLACLSVCAAMSFSKRTKPLSLILEGASGVGKSTILQTLFADPDSELANYMYRSDKFTPKSFVSHAANVKEEELEKIDLLPKLKNKVLVTKELAPIFRGKETDLQDNFSILIAVLDGKGFTSDTGMRGQRGYTGEYIFNWLGATTPLPPSTHRLMSQLGTRLLFFEIPSIEPTLEELFAYAKNGSSGEAEVECKRVVNEFLSNFYSKHPIGSVDPDSINFPDQLLDRLVRYALLIVKGRTQVIYESNDGRNYEPIGTSPSEKPHKVINYLKEIAWGHALVHGRDEVNESDIGLVEAVAISSIPGHLRPIIKHLKDAEEISSTECQTLFDISRPTARKYLKELNCLGLVEIQKGSAANNEPDRARLAESYQWLREDLEIEIGLCG